MLLFSESESNMLTKLRAVFCYLARRDRAQIGSAPNITLMFDIYHSLSGVVVVVVVVVPTAVPALRYKSTLYKIK